MKSWVNRLSGASEVWMMLSRVKCMSIFLPQRVSPKGQKLGQCRKRKNRRWKGVSFLNEIIKWGNPRNQEKISQRAFNKNWNSHRDQDLKNWEKVTPRAIIDKCLRKLMKSRDSKNQEKATLRIMGKYWNSPQDPDPKDQEEVTPKAINKNWNSPPDQDQRNHSKKMKMKKHFLSNHPQSRVARKNPKI